MSDDLLANLRASMASPPRQPDTDMDPGSLCEDCGHFAMRHVDEACRFPRPADNPCDCAGMLWRGDRYVLSPVTGAIRRVDATPVVRFAVPGIELRPRGAELLMRVLADDGSDASIVMGRKQALELAAFITARFDS